MSEKKRILTTGEIAEYCGVNFRTVIRWIDRGILKSFKLPGRGDNRVQIQDFLDFLRVHDMPVPEELQETSRRVLIVEDDRGMARAIQRALQRAGFETEVAVDGFSAGALFGTFKPAVATVDLQIPGMSGLEVLKFVRSKEDLKGTKVLIVSASPPDDLDAALFSGADDVLEKPFSSKILVEKVCRLAGVPIEKG